MLSFLTAAAITPGITSPRRLVVPETVRPAAWPSDISERCERADGNRLQGVHADPARSPLAASVLARVPELASWDDWYAHPPVLSNGHVHTIVAAKLRSTRAVRYYRALVPTPDGGTIAIDLLAGIRRAEQRSPAAPAAILRARATGLSSLFRGGAIAGLDEDTARVDTIFVDTPPPLEPDRPLMLLASGLGGGSQDTYVRSMAVSAAERGWQVSSDNSLSQFTLVYRLVFRSNHTIRICNGNTPQTRITHALFCWQVAVINMRACGNSPVTSPRLFSAYRGANDDMRTAVRWLRRER